jgi:hypothetical protein
VKRPSQALELKRRCELNDGTKAVFHVDLDVPRLDREKLRPCRDLDPCARSKRHGDLPEETLDQSRCRNRPGELSRKGRNEAELVLVVVSGDDQHETMGGLEASFLSRWRGPGRVATRPDSRVAAKSFDGFCERLGRDFNLDGRIRCGHPGEEAYRQGTVVDDGETRARDANGHGQSVRQEANRGLDVGDTYIDAEGMKGHDSPRTCTNRSAADPRKGGGKFKNVLPWAAEFARWSRHGGECRRFGVSVEAIPCRFAKSRGISRMERSLLGVFLVTHHPTIRDDREYRTAVKTLTQRSRPPWILRLLMNALEGFRQKRKMGWSRPQNKVGVMTFHSFELTEAHGWDLVERALPTLLAEFPEADGDEAAFLEEMLQDRSLRAFVFVHEVNDDGALFEGATLSLGRIARASPRHRDRFDLIVERPVRDGVSAGDIRVRAYVDPFVAPSPRTWPRAYQCDVGGVASVALFEAFAEYYRLHEGDPDRAFSHWTQDYIEYFGPRTVPVAGSAFPTAIDPVEALESSPRSTTGRVDVDGERAA